jgi:hypothetical protein
VLFWHSTPITSTPGYPAYLPQWRSAWYQRWLREGLIFAICCVHSMHTSGSELNSRNQNFCYPIPWKFSLAALRRFDMQFNEVAPLLSLTTRKLSHVHLIHFTVHGKGINFHERILKWRDDKRSSSHSSINSGLVGKMQAPKAVIVYYSHSVMRVDYNYNTNYEIREGRLLPPSQRMRGLFFERSPSLRAMSKRLPRDMHARCG